jgi:hypothetical protein
MARYEQFTAGQLTLGNGKGLAGNTDGTSSVVRATLNLGTLTANTVTAVTGLTLPGVTVNDTIVCTKTNNTTVGVLAVTPTAANTVTLTVIGAAGTYATAVCDFVVIKTA